MLADVTCLDRSRRLSVQLFIPGTIDVLATSLTLFVGVRNCWLQLLPRQYGTICVCDGRCILARISGNMARYEYGYTIATLTLSISMWSQFRHIANSYLHLTTHVFLKAPDDLMAARFITRR